MRFAWLVLVACASAKPVAPVMPASNEIEAQVRTFLHHFENLEWEPFIASFTDDACVFHPTAKTPNAFCGRDAVRAKWQLVFDGIRAGATSGPPYQHLDPIDLRVTVLGPDAALATFELHNAERTARRSVVLVRRDGAWKILHIHASNVPWPDL
ncbi:MAG: nuclear transport factor 2 family protein [Kofleriaceae bacterium]